MKIFIIGISFGLCTDTEFGNTRFDLFANSTTSAHFTEDSSQPQILIAVSVERLKAHKMPFKPSFKEVLSENRCIGPMEDNTFSEAARDRQITNSTNYSTRTRVHCMFEK